MILISSLMLLNINTYILNNWRYFNFLAPTEQYMTINSEVFGTFYSKQYKKNQLHFRHEIANEFVVNHYIVYGQKTCR